MASAQEAPPKKKRGFLDRLNDKLDQINQKLDPNAPKPPAESGKPATQPAAQRDRKGICSPVTWKRNPEPDPAAVLPTGWSIMGTYSYPEAIEPAGTFTLEQLGRTRSIRAMFAPRMSKILMYQGREKRLIAYRDPSAPFEAELTFDGGLLRTAYCDENGVYHDSGVAMTIDHSSGEPGGLTLHLDDFNKRGGMHIGNWKEFDCKECYFINYVFPLDIDDAKVVVLVQPQPLRYYMIRIPAGTATVGATPSPELCTLKRNAGFCEPAPFDSFERTIEPAFDDVFPGAQTNRWYAKCKSERCAQRSLSDLAGRNQ